MKVFKKLPFFRGVNCSTSGVYSKIIHSGFFQRKVYGIPVTFGCCVGEQSQEAWRRYHQSLDVKAENLKDYFVRDRPSEMWADDMGKWMEMVQVGANSGVVQCASSGSECNY